MRIYQRLIPGSGDNCMTLIAGKDASETGRVMVGHNEDDGGRVRVRHARMPAMDWQPGTVLPAEEGCARIPQLLHTNGYFWSEYRRAESGLSNADSFYNEYGVLIVSNSMGKSREDDGELTDGGIVYELRRALAERARTARDGAKILMDLVNAWGYASSGRAYTIADKDEAFMFQLVRGKHFVGARVPDGDIVAMPNHYNFHHLNDYEEMFWSPDIVSYAQKKGWYDPVRDGEFDFAKAYQAEEEWRKPSSVLREKHALSLLLGCRWDDRNMPFSVPAKGKVTLSLMRRVLSDHYENTEDDALRAGPGDAPHDTQIRRICTGTTLESMICDFEEDCRKTTLWICPGRPCELPYFPVHPLLDVPKEFGLLKNPVHEMETHFHAKPDTATYEHSGMLQKFRDRQNALEMCYRDRIGATREKLDLLFACMEAENSAAEQEAPDRIIESDKELFAGACAEISAGEFCGEGVADQTLSLRTPPEKVRILFALSSCPKKDGMVLNLGSLNVQDCGVSAGYLEERCEGQWAAEFDGEMICKTVPCPGEFEFFLGGRTENGKCFVRRVLLNFHRE